MSLHSQGFPCPMNRGSNCHQQAITPMWHLLLRDVANLSLSQSHYKYTTFSSIKQVFSQLLDNIFQKLSMLDRKISMLAKSSFQPLSTKFSTVISKFSTPLSLPTQGQSRQFRHVFLPLLSSRRSRRAPYLI